MACLKINYTIKEQKTPKLTAIKGSEDSIELKTKPSMYHVDVVGKTWDVVYNSQRHDDIANSGVLYIPLTC